MCASRYHVPHRLKNLKFSARKNRVNNRHPASGESGALKKKTITYRELARKDYLAVGKQRRPSRNAKRKAIKKQLQYIKRNLGHIEELTEAGARLSILNKTQYKSLLVIAEVYRQQQWLWSNNKQSIPDRIVSITRPHIRPIVRGKAGTAVESGAKLSASCIDGSGLTQAHYI